MSNRGSLRLLLDKKVSNLKDIIDATSAKIVLVSSWKEGWKKEPQHKKRQDFLANYLDEKLAIQGLKIVDKTKEFNPYNRGRGILDYLDIVKKYGIEVEKFVILDDQLFDYKKCDLERYLVQTNFYSYGLTKRHKDKAISILNNK